VSRSATSGARAVLLAAVAALAVSAGAAQPAPLPARLALREDRLQASVDLSAAFTADVLHELGNGLTNVVAVYVTVVPEDGSPPTALFGRVVELLYDVWEETYTVTVKDPRTPQGKHVVLRDGEALRRFLSDERDLDLGPASALPRSTPFHLEARVEVNPVSKEQLQRTREYIANPSAGTRTSGGTRSVLGAMASFLLREPDAGSDVHLLRSRTFRAGEVAAR
jgi:hypothetical protein